MKRNHEFGTFIFTLIVLSALLIASVDYVMERRGIDLIEDDGPLEEFVEDIIEARTGLKIDLTPDSPEPKK